MEGDPEDKRRSDNSAQGERGPGLDFLCCVLFLFVRQSYVRGCRFGFIMCLLFYDQSCDDRLPVPTSFFPEPFNIAVELFSWVKFVKKKKKKSSLLPKYIMWDIIQSTYSFKLLFMRLYSNKP